MIHVDSFSGGIAQLTKKKCKDRKAVLSAQTAHNKFYPDVEKK